MSGNRSIICVIGGGSRIAAALVPILGHYGFSVSRRSTGHAREILVEDYAAVSPAMLARVTCVVNCVGISSGTVNQLQEVNVRIAHRLAEAAKAAGARHFIQVSSFSVYGGARHIDRTTPEVPTGEYGSSKLSADRALLAMADMDFAVTLLRLPLIYSRNSLGKLGQLLRFWKRTRWLPIPVGDVSRAMISVDLSAQVIAQLIAQPRSGVILAADPRPFRYADAAHARPEPLHRLPVPQSLTRLAERIVPKIGQRLFADSHLANADNLAIVYGLTSQLYGDIAAADLR